MFRKTVSSRNLRNVALLLLVLIAAPLAISGLGASRLGKPAGVIFGKSISREEFQKQRAWILNQLSVQFGDAAEMLGQMGSFVDQSTWDRLILLQEGKHRRVAVGDRELARFIQAIDGFKQEGEFDRKRYQAYLEFIGISPQDFERFLRQDLTLQKLGEAIKSSVILTDEDVRAAYRRNHEQITALVIFFEADTFKDKAASSITADDLRAAYEAQKENYRVAEQITFDYAAATRAEAASTIQPDEAAIEKCYEDYLEEWPKQEDGKPKPLADIQEPVRSRAITEEARKRLTSLSLDIQEDLDAKKTFDDIIKARSLKKQTLGPLSPATDLWVAGGPEPAIVQAAAKLQEGQTSELIQTDQGIYLVKLTKRTASFVPAFEEVADKVRQGLVDSRAKALARKQADALHRFLSEKINSGARYEEAAAAYPGKIPVSSFTFMRGGSIGPLGAVPAANAAAFETALGLLTAVIEAPNGFAILRPEKKIEVDFSQFAEEEANLRKETLAAQQSAKLNQWMVEVRSRARLKRFDQPLES